MTHLRRMGRVMMEGVSAALRFHPPAQDAVGEWTSAAETHAWFLQGKGIFTGAFHLSPLRR